MGVLDLADEKIAEFAGCFVVQAASVISRAARRTQAPTWQLGGGATFVQGWLRCLSMLRANRGRIEGKHRYEDLTPAPRELKRLCFVASPTSKPR